MTWKYELKPRFKFIFWEVEGQEECTPILRGEYFSKIWEFWGPRGMYSYSEGGYLFKNMRSSEGQEECTPIWSELTVIFEGKPEENPNKRKSPKVERGRKKRERKREREKRERERERERVSRKTWRKDSLYDRWLSLFFGHFEFWKCNSVWEISKIHILEFSSGFSSKITVSSLHIGVHSIDEIPALEFWWVFQNNKKLKNLPIKFWI